ncbi:unnamed protein product [Adineta steineri]|uniref:Uncharacterized protein n=1 Tax=Adineta steineri TaxID=433720 RepID=A0A818PZB6_9BILA|nr:unnamed protein product [Adineta steineri]
MFWECHILTSSIDKLLDQPVDQIKLQDFLDENDLIQECLNQNKRLLDYLVQANIMQELIHHVITLPKDDNFRNANVVSELLSGDFQRIQDTLLEKVNLDLLYSFLLSQNNEILNPILASYFSRIINTLIIRKPNEIINYFKTRETFKDDFLHNLDATSITDILYRLISDSGDQRSDTIKWYEDINLIDGLIQQLLITESKSVQINIASLLSEFLRLAFDQQTGIDCDTAGTSLTATIERLLHGRNDNHEGTTLLSHLSSISNDEKQALNAESEEKLTPVVLAQHILSKSNLEQIFDALIKRPTLVIMGCDFLESILDLLSRQMPVPVCIPIVSKDNNSSSSNNEEPMQVNDEEDSVSVSKSNENENALIKLAKDPLIRIYLTLLEIIPSRLPSLIALLSTPCPPLIPLSDDKPQKEENQFINEPLGPMRLNLIKFFSKLIYTISNDYTGDNIYQILNSNHLFQILIDLFLRHVYNNFLHTQVYLIIRLIIHINSTAVKQSNDIWTRTSLPNQEQISNTSSSSSFHYTNRCSYKLFQSLLNPTEINLFERLLDKYEVNVTSSKPITSSKDNDDDDTSTVIRTRFVSPNSGHIAQILRYLRDHASTHDNYSSSFKSNKQEQIDEDTNLLEIRWQTAQDYLNEDEKKWSAMHINERTISNYRLNSSMNYSIHSTNANESPEATLRRQTFHMSSFGGRPYIDDDDEEEDEEVERFDIDDELMKNDQTSNEKKVVDMKKISFDPQFPTKFTEQSFWYQENEANSVEKANNNNNNNEDKDKMTSAPTLPDLFGNHRIQQEKTGLSTESNFEQLCSLRANDNGSDSGLFPFQSSSTIRDEIISKEDAFWQDHPIHLATSNDNQLLNKSGAKSSSSSEDGSDIDDIDDEESKIDSNIPDDEKYFVHTDMETNEYVQPNNMMDIFRRQLSNNTNEQNDSEKNELTTRQEPISSSTPERSPRNQFFSEVQQDENESRKILKFTEEDEQENGNMTSDDNDNDLALQNNFSFLIAKGMLKPSSS